VSEHELGYVATRDKSACKCAKSSSLRSESCDVSTHIVFVEDPEHQGRKLGRVPLREELLVDLDEALQENTSKDTHQNFTTKYTIRYNYEILCRTVVGIQFCFLAELSVLESPAFCYYFFNTAEQQNGGHAYSASHLITIRIIAH
jgi:hypothetical protein